MERKSLFIAIILSIIYPIISSLVNFTLSAYISLTLITSIIIVHIFFQKNEYNKDLMKISLTISIPVFIFLVITQIFLIYMTPNSSMISMFGTIPFTYSIIFFIVFNIPFFIHSTIKNKK
ncbi:hypothetical protein HOD20_10325 [archaeon]|nr:hypothetical protein [archaeon]MBT4352905.1 hypothetical protein [archaeon]MBT4648461.1 hypothetical protein [archaeon]MBT6821730.1 hypothetical protein [archaeon]MBT7391393.1 hypothetical protein [archaeon]